MWYRYTLHSRREKGGQRAEKIFMFIVSHLAMKSEFYITPTTLPGSLVDLIKNQISKRQINRRKTTKFNDIYTSFVHGRDSGKLTPPNVENHWNHSPQIGTPNPDKIQCGTLTHVIKTETLPKPIVFQLRSHTWFQDLMKLRFLISHHWKNSVKDKMIGKKWIYLERNTLCRQGVGHHRGLSVALKSDTVSFYGLDNFIG